MTARADSQPRPQPPYPPLLMSEAEAAVAVGLGVTTIRTMPGFPRPVRVGRRRLYRYDDLRAWALSLGSDGEADEGDDGWVE